MPKFNLNWLYMIIAMMLLGLYLTNESGTATKNISYDEFQQYVRDGYISKVIGYDDNSVEAYVKPQARRKRISPGLQPRRQESAYYDRGPLTREPR